MGSPNPSSTRPSSWSLHQIRGADATFSTRSPRATPDTLDSGISSVRSF
jgi:hypothetical protein